VSPHRWSRVVGHRWLELCCDAAATQGRSGSSGGGTPSRGEPRNHYLYIMYPTAAIAMS